MQSRGPGIQLFIWILGILIPPSGQASGSKSCWKMQSQGLGIQSYQAVNMIFWYFVQHTSPNKKHNWKFLISPFEPALGSLRCLKIQSWGPGIQSFEAVDEFWGICLIYLPSDKNIFGTYDNTFSAIKKIKIYRKRLTFHLVELRPK